MLKKQKPRQWSPSPICSQVFWEIKAVLQLWRGIKQPITSFSTSSSHYIQTTDTDTHSDWMGPIIQPVQKGSSVRFIQVLVCVYVFVWKSVNGLFCVNKWEKTQTHSCAAKLQKTLQEWDAFSSQHVRYLVYLLIDLYKS